MNYSSVKTDKLINFIPFISGIALIAFMASGFNYSEPADIFFNNGILSLSYPLLFIFTGYKYGQTQNESSASFPFRKQLRLAGIFYAFAATVTLIWHLLNEDAFIHRQIFRIFTGGLPTELWFLPAGILSVLAFRVLKKKLKTKTILKISTLLFLLSLLISTYGLLPVPLLPTLKSFSDSVFAGSHCGLFSAMLFVSLGVKLSEKATALKTRTLVFIMCASFIVMLIETALFSTRTDANYILFFLSSFPAAFSIFSLIAKFPDIKSAPGFTADIGVKLLFAGQLLCSFTKRFAAASSSSLSLTSEKFEVILLLSLVIAFALQAFLNKERRIDSFAYYIEETILFLLKPLAYLMSFIGAKIKNIIQIFAFCALPVLLWFFERGIKIDLCSDIFSCCLVAIILCSLSHPLKAEKKNGTVFTLFLLCALTIYLGAKSSGVVAYNQNGKLLLYFALPFFSIVSNRKDFFGELWKNYSTGIYLSFTTFITYCLMFRPYDITRYKGAFCNANMCGLYLVVICAVALCNLPNVFVKKDFSKNFLHWLVFGASFGFIMLTISRTAFLGALAAILVKMCAVLTRACENKKTVLQITKSVLSSVTPFLAVAFTGLAVSYISVRFVPGLIDRPAYLFKEITEQMEYKVLPGAEIGDENYISPLKFFRAWINRSLTDSESINNYSTGRITIYLEYLKRLSFSGHKFERIHIDGENLPMFAHNAFLQVAYNCGIIAGIFYLVYLLFCLACGSYRYMKKNEFSVYPVILITAYSVCGMFESMETFYYPLFFTLFIGLIPLLFASKEHRTQTSLTDSDSAIKQASSKLRIQKILAITAVALLCLILVFLVFTASIKPDKSILNEMLK